VSDMSGVADLARVGVYCIPPPAMLPDLAPAWRRGSQHARCLHSDTALCLSSRSQVARCDLTTEQVEPCRRYAVHGSFQAILLFSSTFVGC
jgi:hypothetical protein